MIISSYLSHSLADGWGTTVDFTTSFLHSSRLITTEGKKYKIGTPVATLTGLAGSVLWTGWLDVSAQ